MSSVKLNLYDLTGGKAHKSGKGDAMWHSGIVVYDREYYFGDGICIDMPGRTPFGVPKRKADVGFTEIPQEMFESMLESL